MLKLIQPLRVTLVLALLSATVSLSTNSTSQDDSSSAHSNLATVALNQSSAQANSSLPQKSLSDIQSFEQKNANCFSDAELHQHITSFAQTNVLDEYYQSCMSSCQVQRNQSLMQIEDEEFWCGCTPVSKKKDVLIPIKPRYGRNANTKVITTKPVPNTINVPNKPTPSQEIPIQKKEPVSSDKTVVRVNDKYFVPITGDKAKTIKVDGVEYLPVKPAPSNVNKDIAIIPKNYGSINTFKIGQDTFIPLNVIPVVYRKAFKVEPSQPAQPSESKPTTQTECKYPVYLKVNNQYYAPIQNSSVKPLVVEGKTYIPLLTGPASADQSNVIQPTTSERVDVIKIGIYTYVPIQVIPQANLKCLYLYKKEETKPAEKPVIKVNGQHFIPIANDKVKPIVIEGRPFVPVKSAPKTFNPLKVLEPTKEGKIVTFKIGNTTYIPLDVVPQRAQPTFQKPVHSKLQPKAVIKINDQHFVPVNDKSIKPKVVDGVKYIPVYQAPDHVNKTSAVSPNKPGTINTFKVGNVTYIPLNVVPQIFKPIFQNKKVPITPEKKVVREPALQIGDKHYIPVTNKTAAKPITENGVTYIPVKEAPKGQVIKHSNQPTSQVTPIKRNNQTYIPVDSIPKVLIPAFKKTTPVLKIGNDNYVPVRDPRAQPITIDNVKYVPVKKANETHHDVKNAIAPKTQEKITTFKANNYTYIPLNVVPQVYKPTFKNVDKPAAPTKVLLINGQNFAPVHSSRTVKPIVIEGVKYIPVRKVDKPSNPNNTITPATTGKLHTFEIGNKTYIPLSAVPAVHTPYFKKVVIPEKKPNVTTPVLKINDLHVEPITKETVKKLVIGGTTFIPVKITNKTEATKNAIVPKTDEPIKTFKVGNQTYIPLSVVPKVLAPIFKNRIVPVNNQTLNNTVIKVNGENLVPITDKQHKQVILQGVTYVPVHSARPTQDVSTPIVADKKVNTFKVGNCTYIPLITVPKVYRDVFNYKVTPIKKADSPVIQVNGGHFVPIKGENVKPIIVEGKTYIPVHSAPKNVDTTKAIVPLKEGPIDTFKIGSKTYIPISVIPKENAAVFKNKVIPANNTQKITTVISVNGKDFIPITNKTVKPITLEGVKYLPVHSAPPYLNVHKPVTSKTDVNTFKVGNTTYIPTSVIPNTYLPIFKNQPVKATPKTVSQYVININDKTYKPITNETSKSVKIDGKLYIPVHREVNSVEDKKVITPNHQDDKVNTFKVGEKTFIPLAVVPQVLKSVFAYKVTLPVKNDTKPTPVIIINDQLFVPVTDKSVKPIVVSNQTFIPVKVAPEHVDVSKAVLPKKEGEIQTFKVGENTYIPKSVIPKANLANFTKEQPKAKTAPVLTVIKVNNVAFTPNPNAKPIKIEGKTFVPVNKAPEQLEIKNPAKPSKSGKVNTVNVGGQTYIPLASLPKVLKPIFLNQTVKVTPTTVNNHVIQVNGKTYQPITNATNNQIIVGGKVYVPVHPIQKDDVGTKNVIKPQQPTKVNTFKVDDKVYIPKEQIPKVYQPIFNYKVKEVKVVESKVGITVNGQNYIPIQNKTINPTLINGKNYIPVKSAPENVVIKKTIQTPEDTKIHTIKIGDKTFIPTSVIPKEDRATFQNKVVPDLKTSPKVVINVNGQQYHPITDKKVKPIVVDDRVFVPVNKPAKALDVQQPIEPKKSGTIVTFNLGNKTYIPLDVVPKTYAPIFVNKPVQVNNETLHNTVIKVNGGYYVPITNKTFSPVVINKVSYIPVKPATEAHNVSKAIHTSFDGKVNVFNFGNKTYIPVDVIPKVYKPVFTNSIVPAVKSVPKIVIKVNDQHFVPVANKTVKPITKNDVVYIPVKEVKDTQNIKHPITPKQEGEIKTIKQGNQTYIPLKVVPKVYAPIFQNKPVAATKENAKTVAININGKPYTPILNGTNPRVVINGVTFIPVHHAHNVQNKSVIEPNNAKKVNTVKIGNNTFIPISSVPKVYQPVFTINVQPLTKSAPKPITRAIKINGDFFVPIKSKKDIKPIEVDGVKYVPVKLAPSSVVIKKPIEPKTQGTVKTFKIGEQTYVPLKSIPQVYKPVFLNKPVKVTPKTVSETVIKVNGQTFVPVTDKVHKPVVVNGTKFIPVKQAPANSVPGNSTINTNGQKIDTFKIGTNTYIPLVVVPKTYREVFTHKVAPTKNATSPSKVVIQINDQHFTPIQNKKVTPVIINEKVYIPVHSTPAPQNKSSSIKPKTTDEKINVLKIGKETYIPLKVVPKEYKPIFVNKPVAVTKSAVKTTAIDINGKLYKPTNETHKQVVIANNVFIPVQQVKNPATIKTKINISQDKQVDTFKIGNQTYIPLKSVPKAYAPIFQHKIEKVSTKPTPVITVNGQNYVKASPKDAKPIRIEGKTFVPVVVAPIHVDTSKAIKPKQDGKVNTFKIGNHTYIPLKVIPNEDRHLFKPVNQTKRHAPITTVIKINGDHFIPITIKKVQPVVKNGVTYVPVKKAPTSLEISKPVTPKKEGPIDTFTKGNYTYIPLNVIPKAYKPIFKNKPVKPTKQAASTTAIKVNGETFKPILTGTQKTVTINNIKYVPVHKDTNPKEKNVIEPQTDGKVNTFKIGNKHYIPASVIPKAYKDVFQYKVQPDKSQAKAPKVIQVNENHYIPAQEYKPIGIEGTCYVPVIVAPQKVDISNPILPTKKGYIQIITLGNVTYVPYKLIPKAYRSAFKRIVKKTPLIVIKVNGQLYKPSTQKNVTPLIQSGETYIPVKQVKNTDGIENIIRKDNNGVVNTFKKGQQSYIPESVIPKEYIPIFRNQQVPVTKDNADKFAIKLDGKIYSPITNGNHRQILINQTTYIPVHKEISDIGKTLIVPNAPKQVYTFTVDKVTFIPSQVIPASYKPLFKINVLPYKKIVSPSVVIRVNENHYVPITDQDVKKVNIKEVQYIPLKSAPETLEIINPIILKDKTRIYTFKVGEKTYVPISLIPQAFLPVVSNTPVPVNDETVSKTVIQINGQHFSPVSNKKYQSVFIEGKVYIPVKLAPKNENPIVSNKEGQIKTFNYDNKTYIPLDVVPKVYRPVFKSQVIPSAKACGKNVQPVEEEKPKVTPNQPVAPVKTVKTPTVFKVDGKTYTPLKDSTLKPVKIDNQTYIPVQPYTLKPEDKNNKNTVKIGGQQFKPTTGDSPIVIKNITYIPVSPAKKPEGQVPISGQDKKPVSIGGTQFIPAPPKIIGGKQYIPLTPVGKSQEPVNKTKIIQDNQATIKVKDQSYKVNKEGKVLEIDGTYYVPVVAKTKPVIEVNGKHYVPVDTNKSKPIKFDNKVYIPVKVATEKQVLKSQPIQPTKEGPIETITRGNTTYIPLSVIPPAFKPQFKEKVVIEPKKEQPVAPRANNPTHVIDINDKKYVPINNKTTKIFVFDDEKYVPVYPAPSDTSKLTPVKSAISGPVNTFKLGNLTYVPLKAIPIAVLDVFKPKQYVAAPNPVIKVNGNNYVPIKNATQKNIVIEGVTFVPVKLANDTQLKISEPIKPKKDGKIDIFNVGNVTYIPLNVIPKIYKPAFNNEKKPVKENKPTHVININGNHYVPITNKTVKPIVIDNVKYIPVYTAPANKIDLLKPINPSKSGRINTIKVGPITYIPAKVIPDEVKKVFNPAKKVPEKNPVFNINGDKFVPHKNETIKPIVIQDKVYVPVQKASPDNDKKPILPKGDGKVETLKIANVTFIPLNVIPKAYKPAFKDVKLPVKPNNVTHEIKINDQHFVPIKNKTVYPITVNGTKYIPVYTAPAHKLDELKPVAPTKSGRISTFKVGPITYIPADVIPKEAQKVFVPVKQVSPKNPVISVNGDLFVPIKNKTIQPIKIQDKTYVPVKPAQVKQIQESKPIVPKVDGKIETIKIKNVTYIPVTVIPKIFRPVFKNQEIVKKVPNNATHVINVNGKNYVPVNNQTIKPVIVGEQKYVPVYKAPADKVDQLKPITPKTTEKVDTFKIKNVTFIPSTVIPREFAPLFKPKVPVKPSNEIIAPVLKNTSKPQLRINGEYYEPITWREVKYHKADGVKYLPSEKVKPDNVDHNVVIKTPAKGQVLIINVGNVSFIPVAAIPKEYVPIFKNTPLPVVIVNNKPFVPTQKDKVESIVIGEIKYVPVQEVPKQLETKPVLPSPFKVPSESTFKIGGKVYVPVEKIPTKLLPYFKNSSFVPGSKPATYEPFGKDDDSCPCAKSIMQRLKCIAPKALNQSSSENTTESVEVSKKPIKLVSKKHHHSHKKSESKDETIQASHDEVSEYLRNI